MSAASEGRRNYSRAKWEKKSAGPPQPGDDDGLNENVSAGNEN